MDANALLNQIDWRITPATTAAHLSEGEWKPAPHLLKMSAIIASALHKGRARIILTIPPRHGKSEHTSIWTPTWFLDRYPSNRVILATYGAELSTDFSLRVRDQLRQHKDVLRAQLRQDRQNVARFLTEQGGGLYAVGIGGAITGRGANLLLIDDYIKNFEEAQSRTTKQAIYDWYKTTARTRLEPGGSIIIVATRWDAEDLIGCLLRDNPGAWTHIDFPALAVEGEEDPLGREPGEPLWPARYTREDLEETRSDLGSYFFDAMYQQRPRRKTQNVTVAGKLQIVDVIPDARYLRKIRTWDLAATASGDPMVSSLLSFDKRDKTTFIEHISREQVQAHQVERRLKQTAEMDGKNTHILLEIEPGSQGLILYQHLVREVLDGFHVHYVKSNKSKFTRAQPFIAAIENGTVLMKSGTWNREFVDELKTFPSEAPGSKDDQVDSVAHGYNHLHGIKSTSLTWGRKTDGPKSAAQDISNVAWGRKLRSK